MRAKGVGRKVAAVGVVAAVLVIYALWLWFPLPREPGYQVVLTFGQPGEGPGEFKEPIGIAIAGSEIFISEGGNNRIQVFDLNGNFRRTFGRAGEGSGELGRPMLMDIQGGKLYVAEYLNDRVQVFSTKGEHLKVIGTTGSGPAQFDAPGGVAVDEKGLLYVADFYNHRIQVLGPDGRFIRQIGRTGEKSIRGGRFNYPTDVALLLDGKIAVADAYNDRVQVFSPDGALLYKWGGPFATDIHGPFNGWFMTATAVAVGPGGNVFVADFYNHRVQKFTAEGKFLVAIGTEGSGPGELHYPTDVAVSAGGAVYVVDFGNSRVQKFEQIK